MNNYKEYLSFIQTAAYESLADSAKSDIMLKFVQSISEEIKQRVEPLFENIPTPLKFCVEYDSQSGSVTVSPCVDECEEPVREEIPLELEINQPTIEDQAALGRNLLPFDGNRSRANFRIIFPNRDYIQGKNASTTFAEAVRRAGTARVREMNIVSSGVSLVANEKSDVEAYAASQHEVEPGVFVYTNLANNFKKQILEKISNELNLGWTIEILS